MDVQVADDTAAVQRLVRVTTVLAALTAVLALVSVVSLVWLVSAVETQTCITKSAAAISWSNSVRDATDERPEGVTVYEATPAELRDFFDVC